MNLKGQPHTLTFRTAAGAEVIASPNWRCVELPDRVVALADLAEILATGFHDVATDELGEGEAAGMVAGNGMDHAEACRRALGTASLLGEISKLLRSHSLPSLLRNPLGTPAGEAKP